MQDYDARAKIGGREKRSASELIDYIIAKHHIFTVKEIERLKPFMEMVCRRHGGQHPDQDQWEFHKNAEFQFGILSFKKFLDIEISRTYNPKLAAFVSPVMLDFEKLFRLLSYTTAFCGFLALWISGAIGAAGTGFFVSTVIAAWLLESTKWQISEKLGTALIVLALPAYFILWRAGFFSFTSAESILPGVLARLILTLSAIKLLQKKSDRDWIFLYIMAFFQVLLAAGLSISALYFFTFILFVFSVVCTIIVFEIRRTSNHLFDARSEIFPLAEQARKFPGIGRIPLIAGSLILFIVLIAGPMFFLIPRVGGAGIGTDPGGVSTRSGFSDRVRLGGIGTIQQNDEVVMRVRIEGSVGSENLKWRGVSLDTFDGQAWSKSRPNEKETRVKGSRDIIQVDYATGRENLLLQTIYLEPLDTPVLFAASRAVGVQGNFASLTKDADDGLTFQRAGERVSYKVLSDRSLPSEARLRSDRREYPEQFQNYLQLPAHIDPRIKQLTERITADDLNRFDSSRSVERYLQTQFGYTLEQKAGGSEPLSDFLFNVRQGHCEYFATAMAVMLRTKGIATRIVNGFQQGEYNETADAYVVRQRHAHSWVEVYFPNEDVWIPFDPTPAAGQGDGPPATGLTAKFGKYLEALEMLWIQYFVAFDSQEQRSLFSSVKKGIAEYGNQTSSYVNAVQAFIADWWKDVRGENGGETRTTAIGIGAAIIFGVLLAAALLFWLIKRLKAMHLWSRILARLRPSKNMNVVEFYERLQKILAERGLVRSPGQTPLEFAHGVGYSEAVLITQKYNLVRFGERSLSRAEKEEVEEWLASFDSKS